jgi:hypothetical protein
MNNWFKKVCMGILRPVISYKSAIQNRIEDPTTSPSNSSRGCRQPKAPGPSTAFTVSRSSALGQMAKNNDRDNHENRVGEGTIRTIINRLKLSGLKPQKKAAT